MDTGNLTLRTNATAREITVDPATGKARGVAFVDTETGRAYEARGRVVVVAASTLESARLLLLSKSPQHPNGIGNSSGHVGHNFCEHVMGPSVTGLVKDLHRQAAHARRRAARAASTCRASATWRTSSPNSFAATASKAAAAPAMFPGNAPTTPGFGAAYKKHVRDYAGAFISMGGFGEVLPRYENCVELDPAVKDRWGIPVLRFNYQFGDNERKMAEDMVDTAQEMFEAAGFEIVDVDRERADRRLVDPRAGHGAHGQRSEDVGAQSVPAVARRQEPVRRRRQQPRQRVVPEPDVDDHGAGLALVRLPGRRVQKGEL